MTPNFEVTRVQQLTLLLSATLVGAAYFLRRTQAQHTWNRLDRHAPMHELEDGSFPASDPPSTVPAG